MPDTDPAPRLAAAGPDATGAATPSPPGPGLADMRLDYGLGALDERDGEAGPLALFERWLGEAVMAGVPEPTAMTLATVGIDGRPSTRVVLLKGVDARGLVWYTNRHSRKGQELASNPWAALQFHWVAMERVVRIEGRVGPTGDAESDAYFARRPHGSRIGAWASPQSQPVDDRESLAARVAEVAARFGDDPPRPPHWGGYRLHPDRWEFWQGRPSRLHDRLAWRDGQGPVRLAP